MTDASIRKAAPEDAARLAALGARTFTDTFGHLYPPGDLQAFLDSGYTPEAFAQSLADPRQAMWVAERNGEAIGYAQAGPCALPHPEVTPGCGELKRLYVLKTVQGGGLGGRLLAASLDWLQTPRRRLWIGVWSQNHGAQRLYGRYGFEKVGEYEFPVGEIRDQEFILRRG